MEELENVLTAPIRADRKPLQELLPLSQPLRVLIDPCDVCNFRCSFCFQSKTHFKGQIMSLDLFRLVVEQLREFERPINVVHLYGLGEPMLNDNLPEFVRLLKEAGVAKEVAITSNGSRLNREFSKKLVDAGLDRLSISLNGLENEHFKKIVGVEVDFPEMYDQIKYFYSMRRQCHLHIKINGDCFSKEEHERFVRLFKDYSDTLMIDNVVNVWSGIKITNSHKTMYAMSDAKNGSEAMKIYNRGGVCPRMFYELMVHSNGSISPCCVDFHYETENLGNVRESTMKEVWDGERLLALRRSALSGTPIDYAICRECVNPLYSDTVDITPFRKELLDKYTR